MRTTLLIATLALGASTSDAATHDVPGDFPTIAAAVAAAADGDVIKIAKGTYAESVVTNLELTFVGQKGTIWDGYFGAADNDQLTATANNVSVKGIEFRHGGEPISITGDDASISGCTFRSCETGVVIDGARGKVTKNEFTGLESTSSSAWAIEILGGDSVVADNEVVVSYCFGVHLDAESAGTTTFTDNEFETNQYYGYFLVENAAAPRIEKNVISNCYMEEAVIDVDNCDDAKVVGNVLSHMNYDVYTVIDVDGDRAIVSKNVLESLNCYSDDHYGIYVAGSDAKIEKNKLDFNGAGEDYDTWGIYVSGANAKVKKNKISHLSGGGDSTYAIEIAGDDAEICQNDVRHLNDEETNGIYVMGNRATVAKNDLAYLMYGYAIYVSGDDYMVTDNSLKKGNYDAAGILTEGDATGPGLARVKGNSAYNFVYTALQVNGSGVEVCNNKVKTIADTAIEINGDNNTLKNNTACKSQDDAFDISGNGNTLTKCVAKDSDKDGFDINGDGNTLIGCEAKNCAAEGLDNGGSSTNTNVRKCRFFGSRIDYAGDGAINDDIKNKYGSGSAGTVPEID